MWQLFNQNKKIKNLNQLDQIIRLELFNEKQNIKQIESQLINLLSLNAQNQEYDSLKNECLKIQNYELNISASFEVNMEINKIKSTLCSEYQRVYNQQGEKNEKYLFLLSLVEFFKNYKVYWITYMRFFQLKEIGIKDKQIANSIHQKFVKFKKQCEQSIAYQQKEKIVYGDLNHQEQQISENQNLFYNGFLKILTYEEIVQETYNQIQNASNLKLEVLSIMKNKDVNVKELLCLATELDLQVRRVRINLKAISELNYSNSQLYDLKIFYLNTIAFCEDEVSFASQNQRIHHMKYIEIKEEQNILQKGQCVLFCTINDKQSVLIKKASQQIQRIFGISQKYAYNKSISILMPNSIGAIHDDIIFQYFNIAKQQSNYFEENKKKNDQQYNLMEQNLIFAQVNHFKTNLIVTPVKISLQLNQFLERSESSKGLIQNFGFTAEIKDINEKNQLDYILYFTDTLLVQGITKNLYYFLFNINPQIFSQANYINISELFPFLSEQFGFSSYASQNLNNLNAYFKLLQSQIITDSLRLKQKYEIQKIEFPMIQKKFQHVCLIINYQNLQQNLKQLAYKMLNINQLSEIILEQITFVSMEIQLVNPKYQYFKNLQYLEVSKLIILNPLNKNNEIIEHLLNNLNNYLGVYSFEFIEFLIFILQNSTNQNLEKVLEREIDLSCLLDIQKQNEINQQKSHISKQQIDLNVQNRDNGEPIQQILNLDERTMSESYQKQSKQNLERKDVYAKNNIDIKSSNQIYLNEEISTRGYLYSIDSPSLLNQHKQQQQFQIDSLGNRKQFGKNTKVNSQINLNSQRQKNTIDNQQQTQITKNISSFQSLDKQFDQTQRCQLQFSSRLKSQESSLQLSPKSHEKLFALNCNKQAYFQKHEDYKFNQQSKGSSIQEEDETKQSIGLDEEENHKKLKRKLEEQIEIESQKSKESQLAHSKGRLQRYLNNNQSSNVISMTKIIGLLSYFVMIGLTIFLFIQVITVAQNSFSNSSYFVWPMKYSSNLSQIFKTQNLALLLSFKEIQTPSFQNQNQKNAYIQNLKYQLNSTLLQSFMQYISSVEHIGAKQTVFSLMNDNKLIFWLGKYYDPKNLVGSNSIPNTFPYVALNISVVYSDTLISSTVFRYIAGLGNGRPEFYSSKNIQTLVTTLTSIQNKMLQQQKSKDDTIDQQLIIYMTTVIVISFLCIATIQPLYWYIQNQRQIILGLFTTFPVEQLDTMILQVNQAQEHHRNKISQTLKQPPKKIENRSEIKKQTIGRISNLQKLSWALMIVMLFIYFLILINPILNKINTTSYLNSVENISYTGQLIYEVQAYILESLSINYLSLILKLRPNLKPMQLSQYQDYLQDLLQRSQQIQSNLYYLIQNQYTIKSYNSQDFDDFFFKILEGDICDTLNKYKKYQTDYIASQSQSCYSIHQGLLSQGLNTSFKNLISILPELHNLLQQNNQINIDKALNQFNQDYDLKQFNDFEEFIVETISSIGLFLNDLSQQNYDNFIRFQTIILIYQLILLSTIFLVFWIRFGGFLNSQLIRTKKLLRIIDLNNLLQNQYICLYFKNCMKSF
ncbi:transmembrane protein, putative (macronuclear) [Tetrahymena thermophila SB210]|uniref:Transmembrane protein, putative n=1 Tax=Tetrahymena thermophila (strain SB210) TaxID=312017 RepID=I7LSY8_TETTS|nr:transmembrane protein, putative [Tetrahymena thermophila SB210]EAR83920.2 transmembrane protein, putative [Tetrahymena thermophila SB210]|eukprot:XP_001031583.2 transmembrane protein, putative [Tetrahymena thermophila SB210]